MRLYLLQLGYNFLTEDIGIAVPGYLIQTDDGRNLLVDTGLPRAIRGHQQQEADAMEAKYPDDPYLQFTAWIIRTTQEDPADWIENRLEAIGLKPTDIDLVICTHFDIDHSGSLDLFAHAPLVVQRRHFEEARAHTRYSQYVNPWRMPALNFQFVDGDTEILPGIRLVETSGHAPGHQSLLVHLPETGPVILAIDASVDSSYMEPDVPDMLQDFDHKEVRASRRKLIELAQREGVNLIVFGHDADQWPTLRHSPEYYS